MKKMKTAGIPLLAFVMAAAAFLLFPAFLCRSAPGPSSFYKMRFFASEATPLFGLATGRLSKGKFLVAAENMTDRRFRGTVILLLRHDREGAMGLIINLPTETTLSKLFPQIRELRKRTERIFVGGPVAINQMFLLARSGNPPEGSYHVFDNTYATRDLTALIRLAARRHPDERFRVFAGYAGWSAGQLEEEIKKGQWHVMEADEDFLFDKQPSLIWQQLIILGSGTRVSF